jgi:hypothetical protein
MSIKSSARRKTYNLLKPHYDKNIKNLPDTTVFYMNRLAILLNMSPLTISRHIAKKSFPNAYLAHGRVSTKPMWHIPIRDVHEYMNDLTLEVEFNE